MIVSLSALNREKEYEREHTSMLDLRCSMLVPPTIGKQSVTVCLAHAIATTQNRSAIVH